MSDMGCHSRSDSHTGSAVQAGGGAIYLLTPTREVPPASHQFGGQRRCELRSRIAADGAGQPSCDIHHLFARPRSFHSGRARPDNHRLCAATGADRSRYGSQQGLVRPILIRDGQDAADIRTPGAVAGGRATVEPLLSIKPMPLDRHSFAGLHRTADQEFSASNGGAIGDVFPLRSVPRRSIRIAGLFSVDTQRDDAGNGGAKDDLNPTRHVPRRSIRIAGQTSNVNLCSFVGKGGAIKTVFSRTKLPRRSIRCGHVPADIHGTDAAAGDQGGPPCT